MNQTGPKAPARVALFDFDGTLSLIRCGWQEVMIPMMMEILAATGTSETSAELRAVIDEYVWRLTGRETIFQMIELAEQVEKRTGKPSRITPLEYKQEYLSRLTNHIQNRVAQLQAGEMSPDDLMVPGSRSLLDSLREQGVTLYLASGTDHKDVQAEAEMLRIADYFGGRIFGAQDDMSFSKAALVRNILAEAICKPEELIGFGDGYVEIEEVKRAGGFAIGIATDEPECLRIDEWKRKRLLAAGADVIIPNYLDRAAIPA